MSTGDREGLDRPVTRSLAKSLAEVNSPGNTGSENPGTENLLINFVSVNSADRINSPETTGESEASGSSTIRTKDSVVSESESSDTDESDFGSESEVKFRSVNRKKFPNMVDQKNNFGLIFDGQGYDDWAYRVRWGIARKGLTHHLEASELETKYLMASEAERRSEQTIRDFAKENAKVVFFILERISSKISPRVKNCKTASEIWQTLKTLYSVATDVGRDAARRELNSMVYTGGDMARYIEKFEKAANQFRDMGGKLETDDELELF